MKKLLAVLLAAVMVFGLLPLGIRGNWTAEAAYSTGTFEQVTSLSDLEAGAYYVLYGINGSSTGAMKASVSSGKMLVDASIVPTDGFIVNPSSESVWQLGGSDGAWTLYNESAAGYVEITADSTSSFKMNNPATTSYTVTLHATEGFRFISNHASAAKRGISLYKTDFRPYKESSMNTLHLYKMQAGATCAHSNTNVATTPATCTDTGKIETICSDCNLTISVETIPALGHSVTNGVCTVCGETARVYQLVKDVASLTAGDEILFVATSRSAACGAFNGTYLTSITVPIANEQVIVTAEYAIVPFTVGGNASAFTFTSGDGTMGWADGNSVAFDGTNTAWAVTIDENANAIVNNMGDTSRNLRFNATNPRFCCYTSSQTAIQIYENVAGGNGATGAPVVTNTPAAVETATPDPAATPTPTPTPSATPKPVVANVTCDQSGTLDVGTPITLKCATEDATIYWSLQSDSGYVPYTEPLTFDAVNTFVTFYAYASCDYSGEIISSEVSSFTFYFSSDGSIPIKDARVLLGETVKVSGTVTWFDRGDEVTVFTMQDGTAGITCIQSNASPDKVVLGDTVTVSGTVAEETGNIRLNGAELLSRKAGSLPAPKEVDIQTLVNHTTAEAYESMYVSITDAWTPYVAEGMVAVADNTAAIYIYQFKDVDRLSKNGPVNVKAVMMQEASNADLTNGYYLRIQDEDSIEILGKAKAHDADASIASWCYGGGGDTSYLRASHGQYAWTSIGTVVGSTNQLWKTSKGSMSITAWHRDTREVIFSLPTTDYENLRLSADMRVSGSGPSHFKLQYSLDGTAYSDFDNNTFTVMYYAGNDILITLLNDLKLPEACEDRPIVYFRLLLTDLVSASVGNISANSGLNIANIHFEGDLKDGVNVIQAEPTGTVALGSSVVLSNTENQPMEYRFYIEPEYNTNVINDSIAYTDYSNAIQLATLPALLQARIKGDDHVYSFRYTQGKVASLTATSYGGGFAAGREFALKTETADATIVYDITYGVGSEQEVTLTEQVYTAPLTFTSEQFPLTISAYAKAEGYINSDTLTVSLTEKVTGGEKLYFGQFHAHTTLSDGAGTITEAYDYAKNTAEELDFIIVTDHSNYFDDKSSFGTMDGVNRGNGRWDEGKQAAAAANDETFVAGFGYEMTWSGQYGHINTFATEGFVSRNDPQYAARNGVGLVAYYELLTQFPQSISMFNHPGDTFGDFEDFAHYDARYDAVINMVEVGNGEGKIGSSMYWPSYDYYNRALDKGWHLAPANNQDNHQGNWGDSNTCRDVIWTNDYTENGVYQAMRERRMYATEDNNLEIVYHLNDEPFGSVLETKPDNVKIDVSVFDPDTSDREFKLSVIVDNGKTAYSESAVLTGEAKSFSITLEPDYAYYYIRIDQTDGNIAVTAPVWIDEVTKAGVTSVEIDEPIPTLGEELTVTANLFNNEGEAMQITGATYTLTVGETTTELVKKTADELRVNTIESQGEARDTYTFVPTVAGEQTISVVFTATVGGQELILSGSLDLTVYESDSVLHVAIDASHNNEYVSGNYAGFYAPFEELIQSFNGELHTISYGLTDESLSGMDILVISAPFAANGDNGGKLFTEDELNAIRTFADNGGSIMLASRSNYNDATPSSAETMNAVLEALDSDTRFLSNSVYNGGYSFTLSGKSNFNLNNPFTAGYIVAENPVMAFHSSAGITLGESAEAVVTSNADVLVASETLSGGGDLLLTGMALFNSYQLVSGDTDTMNYRVLANLIRRSVHITDIADVRAMGEGKFVAIEAVLTTNASGYSQATAFFDSIYVEDATGGINIFPVSENYQIGQTVMITGVTSSYQGEYQLKDAKLYLCNNGISVPSPSEISTKESMAESTYGKLVTVTGRVTKVSYKGDLIEYIYVDDGSGEARIFFDGYITSDDKFDESWIKVGCYLSATGISSLGMHPNKNGVEEILPRIRVRDRIEIVPAEMEYLPGDVNMDGSVNAADAAMILRFVVGLIDLDDTQRLAADVDGSGMINAADAAVILRYTVGLN